MKSWFPIVAGSALLALAAAANAQQPKPAPDITTVKPGEATADTVRPKSTGRVPQSVLDDFINGYRGDNDAFERAMAGAERELEADPQNAEALAWRSSGLGMRAGKAFGSGDFKEGMRLWQESIGGMNKAVEMEPGNVHIRFVRGKSMLESSLHDPNPMTSGSAAKTAVDDLELALGSIDDLKKRMPKATLEEFYAWLYQASEKIGDKERAAKYKKLAGDRAKAAEERLADSAKPSIGETVRSALAILDTPLSKELKTDLTGGVTDSTRMDKLLAKLSERLAADPGSVPLMSWRGFAKMVRSSPMFGAGEFDAAIKLWEDGAAEVNRAVSGDATSQEAMVLRGLSQLERARHEPDAAVRKQIAAKAASDFARVDRLIADSGKPMSGGPDAAAELAMAAARAQAISGDIAKARATLEAALDLTPSEVVSKRMLDLYDRLK